MGFSLCEWVLPAVPSLFETGEFRPAPAAKRVANEAPPLSLSIPKHRDALTDESSILSSCFRRFTHCQYYPMLIVFLQHTDLTLGFR